MNARGPSIRISLLAALAASIGPSAPAAASAVSDPHTRGPQILQGPAGTHLVVVGGHGTRQRQSAAGRKLDAVLADLVRHAGMARAGHVLQDLRSLSPAARFTMDAATGTPLVLVDAVTRSDPRQLEAALVALGLRRAAVFANDVGGWLPVNRIGDAAARGEAVAVRAAMPRTRRSATVSQGDYAQRSDVVRTTYPSLTGTGITVGVLSDSFDCYAVYAAPGSGVPASGYAGYAFNGKTADFATDVSTGALPAAVNVLEEANCLDYLDPDSQGQPTGLPLTDEGRAMLQIVHDVAPGASLAFRTGQNSEADFANGIGALAAAGARVIADDLGYFDEPFFQDGLIAQAVDRVEAAGVAYFSAAGNDGSLSYENTAPSFATAGNGANAGEYLLNFDTTAATTATALPVTIPSLAPGQFVGVVVEWDQPYVTGAAGSPGASSEIDVCLSGASGGDVIVNYDNDVVSCSGPNAVGADPVQVMIIGNPANAAGPSAPQDVNVVIGLAGGTAAPGRIIVSVEDDGAGSSINQFATHSATLQGHPGAAGAAAVGAAFYFDTPRCGTTPAQLERYSSQGGAPILFDTSGRRLATPVVRQKPDFVGPDGVSDTFLGFSLYAAGDTGSGNLLATSIAACQNDPNDPNYFGTSAATPHAAGIAALLLQANGATTPSQVYAALRSSALAMGSPSPNYFDGYGFIQADAALAQIPPGAPTLALAASSVAAGSSTTITWSSLNATACTASGSWSGSLAASGSSTLTPAAAGTETYSLTCANAAGTSTAAAATLTVTAAAASGTASHGGGASGPLSLLGLAALTAARLLVPRRISRWRLRPVRRRP